MFTSNQSIKIGLAVGITIIFLGASVAPSTQGIEESNHYHKELNSLLKFYGLNIRSTIGEFEHILYKLIVKGDNRYPSLTDELKNDIETLSKIFVQIGITDDMTISQALPLIKKNREKFQEEGINLFCVMRILGHPGRGLPYFRLLKCLFGIWYIFYDWPEHYVKINSLIIGLQFCEAKMCEDTEGKFIGLITFKPPAIYSTYIPVTPYLIINGLFTLFSKSNVPFVKTNNTSK